MDDFFSVNQTICMHVNISDKVLNFRNDTELGKFDAQQTMIKGTMIASYIEMNRHTRVCGNRYRCSFVR